MKTTKAHVLKAARVRWGANVEAFGHTNTIGRASTPYARDGQKEFYALVRRGGESTFLANETAPTAAEAWEIVLRTISTT